MLPLIINPDTQILLVTALQFLQSLSLPYEKMVLIVPNYHNN